MSISSVSSVGAAHVPATTKKADFQQRKTDFDALAQALSSNDLAGAQAAFAKLQSDPRLISANNNSSASPQRVADLKKLKSDNAALGAALSSGHLATAKSAFANLKSDMATSYSDRMDARNNPPATPDSSVTGAHNNLRGPVTMNSGGKVDVTA